MAGRGLEWQDGKARNRCRAGRRPQNQRVCWIKKATLPRGA